MANAKLGLAGMQVFAEKLFDKIPVEAFTTDYYMTGGDKKAARKRLESNRLKKGDPSQTQGSTEDDDQSTALSRQTTRRPRPRRLRSSSQPNLPSHNNQPRRPSDEPYEPPVSYDYSTQGYAPTPSAFSQGDPNFSHRPRQQSLQQPYPIRTRDLNRDADDVSPRHRQDEAFWREQDRVEASPVPNMQNDAYYPPPSGNNYHRYNPSDYQPQNNNNNNNNNYGPPARYQADPYARPYSAGGTRYYDDDRRRQSNYDDNRRQSTYDDRDRKSDRRDRRRARSNRRRSSSSGSEKGGIRGKFDTSEHGLKTSAIGALAGGLIGNEVGKGPLATVAGLLIGGLGANAWEKQHDKDKDKKKSGSRSRSRPRRARSEDRRSRRASTYDDRNSDRRDSAYTRNGGGGGGGGGRYSDDYEDPMSDDSYIDDKGRDGKRRAEKAKKKEARRQREDREEREGTMNWNNILHT